MLSLWCQWVFKEWPLTVLASFNSLTWLPVSLLCPHHVPWGRGVHHPLPVMGDVPFPSLGPTVLADSLLGFPVLVLMHRFWPFFCCPLCVLSCIRLIFFLLLPWSVFCCRFSVMDLSRARSPCFFLRGLLSASSGMSFLLVSPPSWTLCLFVSRAFPAVSAEEGPWETTLLGGEAPCRHDSWRWDSSTIPADSGGLGRLSVSEHSGFKEAPDSRTPLGG